MATARLSNSEKNWIPEARNPGKPTTDILDRIKEAMARKGIIKRMKITREMAWDILILNKNNRPVKLPTVKWMEEEMLALRWRYTVESIVAIDSKGNLHDGQHRLLAIFKSGKSQHMDISTGWDPEDFKVLNQGRVRTSGDTIALEGVKDPNMVSAAINFVIGLTEMNMVISGARTKVITKERMIDWFRDEKNRKRILECVETSKKLYSLGPFLGHAIYAGMLFVLTTYRKADGEEFITRLATGENISRTEMSSIYQLRSLMVNWRAKSQAMGIKKASEMRVWYIIVAWNHYVQKEEITTLRMDRNQTGLPKIRKS